MALEDLSQHLKLGVCLINLDLESELAFDTFWITYKLNIDSCTLNNEFNFDEFKEAWILGYLVGKKS